MRILGFIICFALMLWIMDMVAGISAFVDTISLAIVFGGGIAYALAKGGISQNRDQAFLNFADGAVYWGWLGMFVGGIGMATAAANLTEAKALGSALAILFLPPLYGYFTKWMIIAAVESTES
ncbi:hypothetical protein N9E70_00820 [bacterium]|nr:hypothetical protein [bacterium]